MYGCTDDLLISFPLYLRSLPFLEQTDKLNLTGIIIMSILPTTGSPSNPWFPTQKITVNLFSLTLFCFWGLKLWTWDKGIFEHLLNFSAFIALLTLLLKWGRWKTSGKLTRLYASFFEAIFGFHLQTIYFAIYRFTWMIFDLSCLMRHRESEKKLNVCVLEPINSNFYGLMHYFST